MSCLSTNCFVPGDIHVPKSFILGVGFDETNVDAAVKAAVRIIDMCNNLVTTP